MLAANLVVAAQRGATTIGESATTIEERRGGGWQLITDSGRVVHADRVLVTTGPHTDELTGVPLPPATVRGETVVQATLGPAEQQRLEGLPSVLARISHRTYDDLYLVPPTTYPDGSVRLKLGATRTHTAVLSDAARRRSWMRGNDHAAELDELRSLTEQLVPGLAADAWETKPCLITETPTGLPYVDHVADTMVVAFGGNGYAAKSANAIGSLAVALMMAGRWTDTDLRAPAFAVPKAIGGLSRET